MRGEEASGRAWIVALGLFVVTIATYSSVGSHDFVNYDDLNLIVNNPRLTIELTPATLASHLWRPFMGNWLPLHWMSIHLGHALHGPDPAAFLLTNVVIHACTTVLLFATLLWMTGAVWRSAFVAAIFALHPLHVESVARGHSTARRQPGP
jgi:hypothetical protein